MLKLFRRRLGIETVAADIVADFLDTEVRLIFELLEKGNYEHASIEQAEETFAFVYLVAVLGINFSTINQTEKERLLTAITNLWLEKFIRPIWEAAPFLQDRAASYLQQYDYTRSPPEFTKVVQMYMERLGINNSKHVAFLASTAISVQTKAIILRNFINDLSTNYKFS